MTSEDVNKFLDLFIQESGDRFEELNQDLVMLEEHPENEELLYSILRHVHSLKGSSGMFGFDNLKTVAHRIEDLVDIVHQNPNLVDRDVMDALFEGCDILQAAYRQISEESRNTGNELSPREKSYLKRLDSIIIGLNSQTLDIYQCSNNLLNLIEDIIPGIEGVLEIDNLKSGIEAMKTCLASPAPESTEKPQRLEKEFTLNGKDVSIPINTIAQTIEKAQKKPATTDEIDDFFKSLNEIIEAAEGIKVSDLEEIIKDAKDSIHIFSDLELDFDSLQAEYYREILDSIILFCETPATAETSTTDDSAPQPNANIIPNKKTVRIDEAKIDTFLDSVGEMIILGEIFNNLHKRLGTIARDVDPCFLREFNSANANFNKQVFNLQESLMSIRRVDLRNITANLSRLVRDTSKSLNKEITLEVNTGEAFIDKSLLDKVNTCLVHIVRNSCDHGIESVKERLEKGKPACGTIMVNASNEEGFLLISIDDDGRGIDVEKLRQQAISINPDKQREIDSLTEAQILDFVFRDGFTTASSVSDISGRGVGMSTVMDTVRSIGGNVELKNNPEKGASVLLRIPISIMLSVIDGLVLRAGEGGFIIPVRFVIESFRMSEVERASYKKTSECVVLRGEIYPILHLDSYFGLPTGENSLGILVQSENHKFCIVVDEIVEHQQVVIKHINGLEGITGILGGALLGDSSIGLVLNVEEISAMFA